MATRQGSVSNLDEGTYIVVWEGLLQSSADVGTEVALAHWGRVCVQVVGTFSTGGEVTLQGSNDGTTWGALHDPQGTDLAIQNSEPLEVRENPRYIRPSVTGGDGSTDLDVYLLVSKA